MGRLLDERARLDRELRSLRREMAGQEARIDSLSSDLEESRSLRKEALQQVDEVLDQLERLDARLAAEQATEGR